MDEFAAHGSRGELLQGIALVAGGGIDGDLDDLVDGEVRRSPEALDDGLAADSLLDEVLDLPQYFAGNHDHGRCAIAHFGVLRPCNVSEDAGGGVDNVQKLRRVSPKSAHNF